MKFIFLFFIWAFTLTALELKQIDARTSERDLIALAIIRDEVKDRDAEWKGVVEGWHGGGPCDDNGNCEDDPCGFDWRGNWEGVECRYQEDLPKDIDRVVTNIHITDSQVGGPIPLGVSLLHDLIELDMDGNRVSGPLTPQVGCLTHLVELDLANNSLSGTIPPAWRGLDKLEEVELELNAELTGCIPQGMPPTEIICDPDLPYCELIGTITDDTAVWGFCQDFPEVNLWCPTPEEVRDFIAQGMPYDSLVSTDQGRGPQTQFDLSPRDPVKPTDSLAPISVVPVSGLQFTPGESSFVSDDITNDDDAGRPTGLLSRLFSNFDFGK